MHTKILLIIVFIIIIVALLSFLIYSISKESFADNISSILADDIKANDEYQQCLNENNQISYLTNGKYADCQQAISELSSNGIDLNTDIGFGKLNEVCPISSLKSAPSKCLKSTGFVLPFLVVYYIEIIKK